MLVILFVGHFDVILRLLSDIRMSLVVIHQWRVVFILCRSVVLSQCIPLPVKPELNPSFPHSPFGMFSSYLIPFTLEVLTSTVFVFQLQESYCKSKKCGRKWCTTNRENRSLMRIVKQNRFKNLGELHKEWTEAGVKASRATTHRHVKEFGYSCRIPLVKPLLNHRQRQRRLTTWAKEKKNWTVAQWSKVLFSDESKFCISFGNQGPRVWRKGGEAHSPSCMKSSVKFPQSVMIWGAMSSAGVGPLCFFFLKTNVTAPVYQ